MRLLSLIMALMLVFPVATGKAAVKNTLPVPRFASIKSNEANIRTGPNTRYPIIWVYVKKGEPIEIIAEFENWRKIQDRLQDQGWIHESMVSGKRTGVIIGNTPQKIFSELNDDSKIIATIEPEVRIVIESCKKDLCSIEAEGYKGWIEKKNIWGVYPKEEFK